MTHLPASRPCDDAMREADQALLGYTVSFRGRCMTRIGTEFVMRDGTDQCVRVPVATTDALVLAGKWEEFSRPANEALSNEKEDTAGTSETAWRGVVQPKDSALVLQGYTASSHGVCLVRVVGNYVTRDGVHRHVRLLVDTVDPVILGAAWAVFGGAAGWVRAAAGIGAEPPDQVADQWADAGEERMASD